MSKFIETPACASLLAAIEETSDPRLYAKLLETLAFAQKIEREKQALAEPALAKRAEELDAIESIFKEADRLCMLARVDKIKAPSWAWAVVQGGIDTKPDALPRLWAWAKKQITAQDELDKIAKYFRHRQAVLKNVI